MGVLENLIEAAKWRKIEWDNSSKEPLTLSYYGNEMGGECGEAQNVIKKLERSRVGLSKPNTTLNDLGDELADVIIAAVNVAREARIDLEAYIAPKFNGTSIKHNLKTRMKE